MSHPVALGCPLTLTCEANKVKSKTSIWMKTYPNTCQSEKSKKIIISKIVINLFQITHVCLFTTPYKSKFRVMVSNIHIDSDEDDVFDVNDDSDSFDY